MIWLTFFKILLFRNRKPPPYWPYNTFCNLGMNFITWSNLMTFTRVDNITTKSRRFHGAHISFFWFPFSFDTFTCTFRSSDYEVCICTALKCPWIVLGFKVPGRQTQQPHQQRLLQSGIWQRQNGSYVSESLGAASWYCGNCRLFAFVLYYGYCSVCLPITSVVITVIFQAIERCVVVSLQSFFLSFLFDCTPKWIPFRKLSVASRKYFSFRPLRCSSSVNLFCSVWSQVNNLTHLFARVWVYVETNLHCIAARFPPSPNIYYVCLFRLVLFVK